jgi:hypothetical protein
MMLKVKVRGDGWLQSAGRVKWPPCPIVPLDQTNPLGKPAALGHGAPSGRALSCSSHCLLPSGEPAASGS